MDSETAGVLGNSMVNDLDRLKFRLKLKFSCVLNNVDSANDKLDESM